MSRAAVLLREGQTYQPGAFRTGLERLGYKVEAKWRPHPAPGDVLVLWNRLRGFDPIARIYEEAGASVIIAENGPTGTHPDGSKLYSLMLNNHNGAGKWRTGDGMRFDIPIKPWRKRGDYVLVLPSRGIGIPGVAMPHQWQFNVTQRLKAITDRPLRVRRHPGASKADPWHDLAAAHCSIVWGSSAGIKSILYGIPCFHEMPRWLGASASLRLERDIEACYQGDRTQLLHDLSWCQWKLSEIEDGTALAWLLEAR